jgi:hypothetical protein
MARGRVIGIRVAAGSRMGDRTSLRRAPTPLDVMDHVLDKGIIIEEPTSTAETASSSHIALIEVTVRVDVTTDAGDALKETTR